MTPRQRRTSPALGTALLQGALATALAGCGDEPPFTKAFTSEHFIYYVEEGATPPCEGTADWLERYHAANAEFLGVGLPQNQSISYFRAASDETLLGFGCSPGAACTVDTTIATTRAVYPHEIVHASASALGSPPALFREGLAEVLGCADTVDAEGPLDQSDPIELLVETWPFVDYREANGFRVYDASASFVRYLIDEIGRERFLAFYARAPWDADREETDAIFRAEMGVGLDEAFAGWRARPAPYRGDLCLRRMECGPGVPAWTSGDVQLGCGPAGEGGVQALGRFTIPEGRLMHVSTEPLDTEEASLVVFYRCGGGDPVGTISPTSGVRVDGGRGVIDPEQPGAAFAIDAAPGEYVAWTGQTRPSKEPSAKRVRVHFEERRSPMRSVPCAAAEEPLPIAHDSPTTLASRGVERACQGPWCPGQSWDVVLGPVGGRLEAAILAVWEVKESSPGGLSPKELYVCEEACPADASQCELLDLRSAGGGPVRSKRSWSPGAVLHLGAPAPAYAGHFTLRLRVAPE